MGEGTGRSSCENKSDRVPLAVRTLEDPLSEAILTIEHRHIGEQQVVGSQGRLSFNHLDRRRTIGTTYDPDIGGILRHECGCDGQYKRQCYEKSPEHAVYSPAGALMRP